MSEEPAPSPAQPPANKGVSEPTPTPTPAPTSATQAQQDGATSDKQPPTAELNHQETLTMFNQQAPVSKASGGSKELQVYRRVDAPPMVTPLHLLSDEPALIDCPFCKQRAMTRIATEGSSTQTLAGVVLCMLCICLACLPCVAGCCENVHIFCTSCNNRVATILHDAPIMVAPGPA
ncbi:hypothetical protein GGR52DRAFT_208119 [Hypoxylon sp. FL1284]|nr:hypothetical protein GGR52DRAFT_208119 [Hypoxylon sp. FL1284]